MSEDFIIQLPARPQVREHVTIAVDHWYAKETSTGQRLVQYTVCQIKKHGTTRYVAVLFEDPCNHRSKVLFATSRQGSESEAHRFMQLHLRATA